jgi:hypothetical protein
MRTGRLWKLLISCGIIILLGISFRSVAMKHGVFSCSAEQPGKAIGQIPAAEEEKIKSQAAPIEGDVRPDMEKAVMAPAASKYDFSDSSHWNLTVSAWENLAQKDYEGVFAYAEKCLELYEVQAKEMAKSMHTFVGFGHEDDFSLVNDVATSHYIMGEAYMRMGDPANALKEFRLVMQEYPYAQCWDPKGWFWKVAEVSKKNIDKIEKEKAAPAK